MAEIVDETADLERGELESLQKHPGWIRLLAFAQGEYSAGAQLARIDALIKGESDEETQARCAREVRCAAKAAVGILRYPEERLKKIAEAAHAPEKPLIPRRAT